MYQQTTPHMQYAAYRPTISSFLYKAVVKNAMDSVLAFLALIILSPLLILIAIRIKQDSPGPILIKQTCEGLRGHPFNMYKFRTHQFIGAGAIYGQQAVLRETYIGAVLREANLENLPQLFSVFIGNMSLVGPRPNPSKLTINNVPIDKVLPNYHGRSRVKPGMTGWAQINGLRGPLQTFGEAAQRVNYDIDYTNEASFLVDCVIIYKTLPLLKLA